MTIKRVIIILIIDCIIMSAIAGKLVADYQFNKMLEEKHRMCLQEDMRIKLSERRIANEAKGY